MKENIVEENFKNIDEAFENTENHINIEDINNKNRENDNVNINKKSTHQVSNPKKRELFV